MICDDFISNCIKLFFSCQEGHTKLSYKKAKAETKPSEVTEDDLLFWSYVAEDERPITLYHIDNYDSDENVEAEEEKDSDYSD